MRYSILPLHKNFRSPDSCLQAKPTGTISLYLSANPADPRRWDVKRLSANRALKQHSCSSSVCSGPISLKTAACVRVSSFFHKEALKSREGVFYIPQGALGQRWCISRLLLLLFRVQREVDTFHRGWEPDKMHRGALKRLHWQDDFRGRLSGLFTSCQTCSRDVAALIASGTSATTWIRSVTGSSAERAQVLQSHVWCLVPRPSKTSKT